MQMRRQLLLLLSLASLTVFSYGQSFAPLGAKWYYSAQAGGMAPQNSEYYLYESQKDTIVDGQSCKKLTVTYYKYLNGDTASLPPVFVYQSTDTVYYYNTNYSKHFPLYFFNVSQGDTLTFHSPNIPFNPVDTIWKTVVDSVTSLIIDSDTLKRVWTTPLGNYSFHGSYIEKLGCDFLMLHQALGLILEHDGPMRCYSDSSISHNFNTFPCDYRLTTGTNELTNPFGLSVYPNHHQSQITLEFDFSKTKNALILIKNIFGQSVKKIDNITFAKGNNKMEIDVSELSKGLYFVQLQSENKIMSKKFVKE